LSRVTGAIGAVASGHLLPTDPFAAAETAPRAPNPPLDTDRNFRCRKQSKDQNLTSLKSWSFLASCTISRATAFVRQGEHRRVPHPQARRAGTGWRRAHSWSGSRLPVVNDLEMKVLSSACKSYDLFSNACYCQFGRSQPGVLDGRMSQLPTRRTRLLESAVFFSRVSEKKMIEVERLAITGGGRHWGLDHKHDA
jgi:hypothetical protein